MGTRQVYKIFIKNLDSYSQSGYNIAMQKFKTGQAREDGMVFLEYSKIHKNGERWVTPEKLAAIRKRKAETAKARMTVEKTAELLRRKRERYANDSVFRSNILEKVKKYEKERKLTDEQRLSRNKRVREKRKSCPARILKHRLRCYIRKVISGKKPSTTIEMLGCSFEFFITHIQNQFDLGMTWQNSADWHIDHVKPLKSAKTESQVAKLFHFSNLRPLWAVENLSKGGKQKHEIRKY